MLVSLTGLAFWDMLLLLSAFFQHALWATLNYFSIIDEPWDSCFVALNSLVSFGHITSTYMLIEVTAERFFAVARPFHFAGVNRKNRRKGYARILGEFIKMPLLVTVLACIITFPSSFEYELEPCIYKSEQFMQHETSLMRNVYYKFLYRTIFLSISMTFGPFIVITLLTVSTLKSMRKSMEGRASILIAQGQNHLFQADKDKTKSLQAISVLLLGKFLLLRCWPTAVAVAQMFVGEDFRLLPLDVSHFFFLLNSATNSFVFVVIKSAFETRRLRRIRERHRQLVAQHAKQVLSIGKTLAGDNLLLVHEAECENNSSDEEILEMKPLNSNRV
ncbi:unnamed protein product [Caenorhabditis bovis]|uniref:G-protein coupled receptors family 1 profile domain-containing protein n=1 Tax=Caenorhabditis bovis TaxID=2654633 RepID=A0A8S1F9K8_9PELO|nr:unnamed protein product [Caenorhabditis bovis]